jgi:hypothetical protein
MIYEMSELRLRVGRDLSKSGAVVHNQRGMAMKKLAAAALSLVMVIGPLSPEANAFVTKKKVKVVRVKRKIKNGARCKQPGAIYIDSRGRRFRCVATKRR